MILLNLTTNPSGGYPPLKTKNVSALPNGHAEVSSECDTSVFAAYRGFVTPNYTDDVVTSFTGNQTLLDANTAKYPDPTETTEITEAEYLETLLDYEYRLTLLELGVSE